MAKSKSAENAFKARTAFLFDGNELVDATSSGHQLLSGLEAFGSPKENLISMCKAQYPELGTCWDQIDSLESIVLKDGQTGVCDLEISKVANRVSIRILDGPEYRGQTIQEDLMASRVEYLSNVIHLSPYLIWREAESGQLLWSNTKYDEFLTKTGSLDLTKPRTSNKRRVFPEMPQPEKESSFALESRQSVVVGDKSMEHWFNVVSFPTEDGSVHFASDANDAVSSDRAQKSTLRTFVQIFAQLSIGFAIFDENRQLKIYNPALAELSGLDPIFLSSKPTLIRILEEMRQSNKAPEPENYSDFRRTIRNLESESKTGTYEAVWTLSDGQSLRVTGRPYPGGSLAYLVEDVSAELTLTRKYRTEIQAYQDTIDCFDEPVFIFSGTENLVAENTAGTDFMGLEDQNRVYSFSDFADVLRRKVVPSKAIEHFSDTSTIANPAKQRIQLFDGRAYQIERKSLSGGFFMLRFHIGKRTNMAIPKTILRRAQRNAQ